MRSIKIQAIKGRTVQKEAGCLSQASDAEITTVTKRNLDLFHLTLPGTRPSSLQEIKEGTGTWRTELKQRPWRSLTM